MDEVIEWVEQLGEQDCQPVMMYGPYFEWKPGQPITEEGEKWDAEVAEEDLQGDRSETENKEDVTEDAVEVRWPRHCGAGTGIIRLEPILKGKSHTVNISKVSFYQASKQV